MNSKISRNRFLKTIGVLSVSIFLPRVSTGQDKISYEVKVQLPKRFFIQGRAETTDLYILWIFDELKGKQLTFELSNNTTITFNYEDSYKKLLNNSMIEATQLKLLYSYVFDFFCNSISKQNLALKCDKDYQSQDFLENLIISDFRKKLKFLRKKTSKSIKIGKRHLKKKSD